MRHLRLAFDERFWEAAEGFLADLPGEEDEGFVEPISLQDLVEIDPIPGDVSNYFFPDADFENTIPLDESVEDFLRCDEDIVDLESLTELPTEELETPSTHFSETPLDYPELPGVNCSSCEFHRQRLNNDEVCCSLCHMRKTAYAVFGKYAFNVFFM